MILGFHSTMSNNQPSSNRPGSCPNQAPWEGPTRTHNHPPQSSRPRTNRSNTADVILVEGGPLIVPAVHTSVTVVYGSARGDHSRAWGRDGGRGGGRGGGGGGGRGGSGGRGERQTRMDEFFPSRVANRIAETQGDNRQGALNARSSRDDGRGRGRPSSDSEGRRQSWDGRAQRGQGGGRDSPQQWASDGRGSPRNQDSERPSHNRLDEATLSNDPARAARALIANETLDILFEEVGWFFFSSPGVLQEAKILILL